MSEQLKSIANKHVVVTGGTPGNCAPPPYYGADRRAVWAFLPWLCILDFIE